ncbi:hypothetical protein ONZ45_g10430 [Pleurotus djamor]|nr:hypothetical protein ONZ45_g10430 [Pleurotus djamor]
MTRSWWLFPTACFGGAIEVLGWIGRLWSSYSVYESTPFQIQILATIIAPTPLVAANFMILGRIILRLGPSYSRLRPKWYTWTFLGCDILGFVIQMLGGLIVLAATNNNSDPTNVSTSLQRRQKYLVNLFEYFDDEMEFATVYQELITHPLKSLIILSDPEASRTTSQADKITHPFWVYFLGSSYTLTYIEIQVPDQLTFFCACCRSSYPLLYPSLRVIIVKNIRDLPGDPHFDMLLSLLKERSRRGIFIKAMMPSLSGGYKILSYTKAGEIEFKMLDELPPNCKITVREGFDELGAVGERDRKEAWVCRCDE